MNVLINFSTLKAGGGQNVAMNFLFGVQQLVDCDMKFVFLVARDSAPHEYFTNLNDNNYIVAPRNPILRILKEVFWGHIIMPKYKFDVIYTYFGFGMFGSCVPQVCGSADSNIYYPETAFWADYSLLQRLKRYVIDQYRIWGVKHADAVVFENEEMQRRSQKLFHIKHSKFIKPSISFDLQQHIYSFPKKVSRKPFKALFLCGWHLNKNIMLIPELAAEMRDRHVDCNFILTAPQDGSATQKAFMDKVVDYNVGDTVNVIGAISKDKLMSLYSQVDCVLLLSKLESFSNNIIEAWYSNKPLIISDEPWSRSICKNAAFYVDRNSIKDIVDTIVTISKEDVKTDKVVNSGVKMLRQFPSIHQRISQELEYLANVCKNY